MKTPSPKRKSSQVWEIPHRRERRLRSKTVPLSGHDPQLSLATGELNVGDHINSRFEILERIGTGGMSIVYRAMDKHRKQEVALKCISPALLQDLLAVDNFIHEVKIASRLAHPGIVKVFDVHLFQGVYFLEMELLEGTNLRNWIKQKKADNAALTVDHVHSLIQSICSPLTYAHTTTIHRDIKPENIAILPSGQVKIMDFGLAQVLRTPNSSLFRQSVSQLSAGTPYYMAPEVLAQGSSVDARADQYSLAVIAYELLTGRYPLGVAGSLYDKRPDLPMAFTETIDRALNHLPEKRFETVDEFARALKLGVRPEGWITKGRRKWKSASNWTKTGVLTLVCGGLTLLSSTFLNQNLLHRTEQIRIWQQRAMASQSAMNRLREQIRSLKMESDILHRKMEVEGAVQGHHTAGSFDWIQASNQWHYTHAAYQWIQPRLNEEGHWDAMDDLLQAARSALGTESIHQAIPLFKSLDQALNATTDRVSMVKEAHRLKDSIQRLNAIPDAIALSPLKDRNFDKPSLTFLDAGSWLEGIQSLKEQESILRTDLEKTFREQWTLFEKAERHWINLFPASIGPPDLRFLVDVPNLKNQAQALFEVEDYRLALDRLKQAILVYDRWADEVASQRNEAREAWNKAQHRIEALDMRFIKVNKVYWSIWETRIMDFARWLSDNQEIAQLILNQLDFQSGRMGPTHPITGLDRRTASGIAIWFGHQMDDFGRPLGSLPEDGDWAELWESDNLDGEYLYGIAPVEDPARLVVYKDYYLDQHIEPADFLKPTGSGGASLHGLFDLQGNAWEWSASDLILDRRESNNQEPIKWKLHGGGYFGQHRFNEFEPPRENVVFITRPQAVGFRVVLTPNRTINRQEQLKP